MKLKHYKIASLVSLLALGSMAVFAEKPITKKVDQKKLMIVSEEVDREIRKITSQHHSIRFSRHMISRAAPRTRFNYQYQQISDDIVGFSVVEVSRSSAQKPKLPGGGELKNDKLERIKELSNMKNVLIIGLYNTTTKEALFPHQGKWLTPEGHPMFQKKERK